jgi:hypothetical protein
VFPGRRDLCRGARAPDASTATATATPTATASVIATATVTPTAIATPMPTPTPTPSATPTLRTPTVLDGGSGDDIDVTYSTARLPAHWDAVPADQAAQVSAYVVCVSTSPTCATGRLTYISNGLRTTHEITAALAVGATYHTCLQLNTVEHRYTAMTCSDGVTASADTTAPTAPGQVNDGTDADTTTTLTRSSLAANWPPAVDAETTVADYEYCVTATASCTASSVVTWHSSGALTGATGGRSGSRLRRDLPSLRAVDSGANRSAATCSNGQSLEPDDTTPDAPLTVDDGLTADVDAAYSDEPLSVSWSPAADAMSGVGSYEYCVATAVTCGGVVVRGRTVRSGPPRSRSGSAGPRPTSPPCPRTNCSAAPTARASAAWWCGRPWWPTRRWPSHREPASSTGSAA